MVFKYGIDQLTVSKAIAIAKGIIRAELTSQTIQESKNAKRKLKKWQKDQNQCME